MLQVPLPPKPLLFLSLSTERTELWPLQHHFLSSSLCFLVSLSLILSNSGCHCSTAPILLWIGTLIPTTLGLSSNLSSVLLISLNALASRKWISCPLNYSVSNYGIFNIAKVTWQCYMPMYILRFVTAVFSPFLFLFWYIIACTWTLRKLPPWQKYPCKVPSYSKNHKWWNHINNMTYLPIICLSNIFK